jgi:DNA-binding transcriptional LysR family regulator
MDLRQLLYFRAVAEEEHFGRASERLHIAQPALSRQVRLLEGELGVALFDRLPRGVRLTAAGHTLLRHSRLIAAASDRAIAETRAAAAGHIGSLRIGFIEVAAWQGVVPDCIRRYRTGFPNVDLALSAMSSTAQVAALYDGQLDGGFLYNPPDDPRFERHPVARHPVILAVSSESELARRQEVDLDELRDMNFIGFRRDASPRFFDDLAAALALRDFVPTTIAEMGAEADMLALVHTGLGIAFINSCQRWRPPLGITFVTVRDLDVALDLAFVFPKDQVSPPLAHFAAMLLDITRRP